MLLLDVMATCNSASLAAILAIVKKVMMLIQIIVPILLILSASIGIYKLMANPERKNGVKNIVNSFIAAAIVFFIPVFLNVIINAVGDGTDFSRCWKNASNQSSSSSGYKEIDDSSRKKSVIGGGDDYESGHAKKTGSNKKTVTENKQSESGSEGQTSMTSGNANKVIFVGDSRTVQLYAYLTGNWSGANFSSGGAHVIGDDVFIAEGAMGLVWMQNTGIPAARSYFGSGSALVIFMGVNDIFNVDHYISFLKENVPSWTSTGTQVYYAAVGPCDGTYSSHSNKVAQFNSKLSSNLPSGVTWIDTYSYLISSGFTTSDGLHYDSNTSNKIYNYIKSKV